MKIGDKVRFLSEVGGGRVSGFQGKNTVLVEDEDGFEIPMPLSEVIVVDTDNYNMAHIDEATQGADGRHATRRPDHDAEDEKEVEPCDRPITFKRTPQERRGADVLSLSLCFVPDDARTISTTFFKAYVLNESNYFMQVLYLAQDGAGWQMVYNGQVEPHSRVCVEQFDHSELNAHEHICIHTMAWKEGKSFPLKPALTTDVRLDCTKFYKLHTFQPSEHFDTPSWIVPIIRDDRSMRSLYVDASKLQESMQTPSAASPTSLPKSTPSQPVRKPTPLFLEVDLHADKLLTTTSGLSASDILDVQLKHFNNVMQAHLRQRGQKIVFIHGKGDGVLRNRLLQELKYRYKNCSWQDASFQEYGYGATQVTIR